MAGGDNIKKMWLSREDVLVSSVFGTAIYLPFKELLGPILKAAEPLNGSDTFPDIGDIQGYSAKLWPTFKEIYNHDPDLINITISPRNELDAFCEFEKDLLIIEAKKPDTLFNEDQLLKYLEAFTINKSKRLWLLLVGKGSAVSNNVSKFKLVKAYNVLYVDWRTILITIKRLSSTCQNNTKYALEDMIFVLSHRQLMPFEGFAWPKEIGFLGEIPNREWFPHFPPMWPKLLEEPILFYEFKELPWQRENVKPEEA